MADDNLQPVTEDTQEPAAAAVQPPALDDPNAQAVYDAEQNTLYVDEEALKKVPVHNIGAFLAPFIWGPAHGSVITVLYYPAWLFIDNLIYHSVQDSNAMGFVFSAIVLVVMVVISLVYSRVAQSRALIRALKKGHDVDWYIKRQRIWVVAAVLIDIVGIVLATIYNLTIRPGLTG